MVAMTPKFTRRQVEEDVMSLNLLARSRNADNCKHESAMRIEVAGMSREVCESCGRVSLGYVENHCHKRLAQSAADSSSMTSAISASAA
jgi:hypothetical protein